jgi:hypothetical protein
MKTAFAIGAAVLTAAFLAPAQPQGGSNPFLGRWDITVTPSTGSSYPDWLELVDKGGKLDGRIQPRGGTVHAIRDARLDGGKLTVGVDANSTWELEISGGKLTGVQKRGESVNARIAGVRAPRLDRPMPKAWTDPEPIFNGKDLTGWEPLPGGVNHWVARDGVLVNQEHGANLVTTRKFQDFKLHIEFNCPDDGNSGIYLRGRDEIQVDYVAGEDKFHDMGSIYGYIAPSVDLPRTPGKWESFDVILVGRTLTMFRNGVKTVDAQEIAGPSGGALDANEGEPGPFYLQGDHTGGMMYRNITISLPK